jgi:four helix bundle protein
VGVEGQPNRTEAKIRSFTDLIAWQKAHQLALEIYKATKSFPDSERFGLISQMRRAVVSVPANLAEGFRRTGSKNKLQFYNMAQGSLEEVHYFIILAKDLGYLPDVERVMDKYEETARLITGLMASIRRS